jgi:hypothetical protein
MADATAWEEATFEDTESAPISYIQPVVAS